MIRDVEGYDVHAAASLWLMLAFGLRFKESLMLRPHVDVATARAAGIAIVGVGFGYTDTPIRQLGPDETIDSYTELEAALGRVLAGG